MTAAQIKYEHMYTNVVCGHTKKFEALTKLKVLIRD